MKNPNVGKLILHTPVQNVQCSEQSSLCFPVDQWTQIARVLIPEPEACLAEFVGWDHEGVGWRQNSRAFMER